MQLTSHLLIKQYVNQAKFTQRILRIEPANDKVWLINIQNDDADDVYGRETLWPSAVSLSTLHTLLETGAAEITDDDPYAPLYFKTEEELAVNDEEKDRLNRFERYWTVFSR